jgi:hypothetical protein
MVYIRVALSDPDIGGKSQSHRVDLTISDDQTIIAVYNGLCGSIFSDLLNSNSRGLDFVVFSGKNNVTYAEKTAIIPLWRITFQFVLWYGMNLMFYMIEYTDVILYNLYLMSSINNVI